MIRIGIDLDNTIICYDKIICSLARIRYPKIKFNKYDLTKIKIKKKIIQSYGNIEWTKFQSIIYGNKINKSILFARVKESLEKLKKEFEILIISHKTKFPAIGKKINLRDCAKKFLKKNDISYCKNELINKNNIFFADTKKKKIEIIKKNKIDIFIDDLDDVLKKLPNKIIKIHFANKKNKYKNFYQWDAMCNFLLKQKVLLLKNQIEKKIGNKIKLLKEIKTGTNNKVYLVSIKRKKFILKIYKKEKSRYSFTKELFFLKNFKRFKEVPKIKFFNKNLMTLIINYIPGKKLKNTTNNDIKKIVQFIKRIQIKKSIYKKQKKINIKFARDNINSIEDIFKNIKKRIKATDKKLSLHDKNNKKLIATLTNVKNLYKNLKIVITKMKIDINKKEYKCLSPSDFNIKNIIKNSNKYYYIDFEYSGIDNYFKLVLDFISQPDINFSQNKIKFIILEFSKIFVDLNKHLNDHLIILNNVKWFYIILNSKYNNKYTNSQILKSINYYDRRIKFYEKYFN